ncbi:VIT1/CCC1 transporter family protein [Patescibacteria group bacterium]
MDHSLKVGISFGLTSAIITTLGLIVGLNAGTSSKLVVIGGILTIAIADAFSDSLGIHISEEAENVHTAKEVWTSTAATFFAKLLFALTFLVPVLLFDLNTAIIVSIAWGLFALAVFSYYIASQQKGNPWKAVAEHMAIGVLVIAVTNFVGGWIGTVFS